MTIHSEVNLSLIKARMSHRHIKQNQLAEKIGISKVALNLMLNGKTKMSVPMAQEISKALGLRNAEILEIFFDMKEGVGND